MEFAQPETDELDVVLVTLYSKRHLKLPDEKVIHRGVGDGLLATVNGRIVLTIYGEMRARELFNRPLK
jgi:hypothetical protein